MERARQIENLIAEIESTGDPEWRARVQELIGSILEFHGDALRRLLELAGDSRQFARDDLVSSLLLLHDLHPDDLDTRVRRAVDRLPYVELTEIRQGVVRLRTLRAGMSREPLEDAIFSAAPDAVAVEIEGIADPSFIPVGRVGLQACPGANAGAGQEAYPTERCELCGSVLEARHPHLLETASRRLVCACNPCALLELTHYRRVGSDVRYLSGFELSESEWASLLIPIDLAFLIASEAKVRVLYPGPAGVTESTLQPEAWSALSRRNPVLQRIEPDVEALLVNRVGEVHDYFIVPIDRCYELTGLLRVHWRGLSGGEDAWREIARFLRELKEEAVTYA